MFSFTSFARTVTKGTLRAASFWGRSSDWPYVRVPADWPTEADRATAVDDDTYSLVKWKRGGGFELRMRLAGGFGSLVQNWFTNALLRAGLAEGAGGSAPVNVTVRTAMKPFP